MKEIFISMIEYRPGTPQEVMLGIQDGSLNSLGELCTAILLSEAISVDPTDIMVINNQINNILIQKGIPEDLV